MLIVKNAVVLYNLQKALGLLVLCNSHSNPAKQMEASQYSRHMCGLWGQCLGFKSWLSITDPLTWTDHKASLCFGITLAFVLGLGVK